MTDVFNETLRSWQTYYFTLGGAAAALLGLMFIAVSLAMPFITTVALDDMKTFVYPSIHYFVSAIVIVGIMLVPAYDPIILGLIMIVGGLFSFLINSPHVFRLIVIARRNKDFILGDWLTHVILPVVASVLLIAGGVCFVGVQWAIAFALMWGGSLLLLLCAIANTWSLVVWIITKKGD